MSTRLDPHGPAPLGGPGRAAVPGGDAVDLSGPPASHGPVARGTGSHGIVRRLRAPVAVALAAAAGVAALGLTDPYRPGGHLVCPVLALTGFYCAGCGAQRAVHDLARLDLAAAWGMNPLLVLVVPVVVVLWARWLQRRWRGSARGRPPEARPAVAWLVLVVVVAFAVLRNVPLLQPWLAP